MMFCFHKWRVVGCSRGNVYDSTLSAGRPIYIESHVTYQCSKCSKVKVEKINGNVLGVEGEEKK